MTDTAEVDGHSSLEVQAFVNNIFDQYKNADETLAKKLGKLNLSNRRRLNEHSTGPKAEKPAETHVRVSGFNSFVTFHESNEQVYVPIPLHYGDDWSPNNNGSKIPTRKESNAYMPPAPWQVKLEAPFKCALCKKIVTLRGHEAWMVHVYADLKAYICIHPLCDQSFEYYHLWAEHVLTSHFPGLKRYCVYCNSEINSTDRTSTRNAFVEHLVYNHWDGLSDAERTAATLDTERFVLAPFNSFPCGICRRPNWKTWFEFAAHIARHLEEISLAALPDEMYSLDESPAARKHRRKRQQDVLKEKPDTLELSLNRRQPKNHEDEEESDLSEEDPEYVRVDRGLTKAPLPSVKKPHRGSLRPRKVHEKVKESKREQDEQEGPNSSPHVKFEDKSRDQNRRKHASHEQSPSKGKGSKGHPVQQYPNEDAKLDAMRSYYKAYQDQYEQSKAGGQGYEGYGYPAAYPYANYSNYYRGSYPYAREGYGHRVHYSGHGNDHANCRCQTCAAMREDYLGGE